jgi:hypothetical protein
MTPLICREIKIKIKIKITTALVGVWHIATVATGHIFIVWITKPRYTEAVKIC